MSASLRKSKHAQSSCDIILGEQQVSQDFIPRPKMSELAGEHQNIALLTFLYVLQGIPLGLAGSVPYLLQSRNITYKEQAVFSFVFWPFSVKLLWAPIVDSLYFASIGRRKSWLVPIQYALGIFMIFLSTQISSLMGDANSEQPVNIILLTIIFFMLNFLAATQDIAVDGWALTMLSKKNVGWASTCNTVGQTAGYFLSYVVFLALESANFCNSYLRSVPQSQGIITFSGFLYFWGIVFLVTTSLVMVMKKETPEVLTGPAQEVYATYKQLWRIMHLPSVFSLAVILLTSKITFSAAEAITGLKLIEAGVEKEKLALLGIPMVPIQIILPLLISSYTAGPRPMDVFLKAYPFRMIMCLVFALVVYLAPSFKIESGYPATFFLIILIAYALHQVSLYPMFVAQMAMHAKVSDPKIGGTYMTLLNTIANLGGNWPNTLSLSVVDSITWKHCSNGTSHCQGADAAKECTAGGGTCVTTFDGFYPLCILCFIIGILWWFWKSESVRKLQDLPPKSWTCS